MPYITAEMEIDDILDDILDDMSSSEKRDLCASLIEEGYGPVAYADQDPRVETYTDYVGRESVWRERLKELRTRFATPGISEETKIRIHNEISKYEIYVSTIPASPRKSYCQT